MPALKGLYGHLLVFQEVVILKQCENISIILALGMIPGMGNTRVNRLLSFARQVGWELEVFKQTKDKVLLRRLMAWDAGIAALVGQCEEQLFAEAEECIAYAKRQDLDIITVWGARYPTMFKRYLGDAAPPLLFVKGNWELLNRTAGAVVGTRNPSKRGVLAAGKAAETILDHAEVLVSGGAIGIDRAAHDAAVRCGGSTVAMLPQGILSWSFPEDWRAAMQAGRVALVSPYLPRASWQTHAAVSRNALISAHAQVVCVVEPRKQGGSILTLRKAVEQHKPAFVTPLSALSAGLRAQAHSLRELGDMLAVTDLADLLTESEKQNGQAELL